MVRLKKFILSIFGFQNKIFNYLLIKYKKVSYETYPIVNGRLFIRGNGKIIFGKNVKFNSSPSANPIGGDTRMTIRANKGATLKIDDYCGISNCAIICHESITIGKHVKIGGSVKIYDTDFHSLNAELRKNNITDIPVTKPVIIGNSCFIGAFSIILKGVSIGNNSIVGAGSVVTKSVPENEIWAGNPARFIKKLDT
ncbi:acyltransferase [Flagellimonas marina]|jgi:acetyltransferase-like isoleucine patch superfamily enzyme|uniref:Acyltransferase n=1 Tax=Flagellimonas marina TaxID=1775168 RepID=A0ABV8PMR1_9FLAO